MFEKLKDQVNPKKMVLEALVGAPFALMIGFLVMMEKKAVAKANEHYFPKEETKAS